MSRRLALLKTPPDISHMADLTDDTGIIQHSHFAVPDPKFGYSTDDNARALIVALKYFKETKDELGLMLARTYLSFLRFAQDKTGKLPTFLTYRRVWKDKPNVGDTFGRALWALGYTIFSNTPLTPSAKWLFDESKKNLSHISSPRSKAFSILGLNFYSRSLRRKHQGDPKLLDWIERFADDLLFSYNSNSEKEWQWFENKLTYENSRLPQALLIAFKLTKKKDYRNTALSALDFLLSVTFNGKGGYFDFVGEKGWFKKGEKKALFDQQPVEAGSTVEACVSAYKLTKEKEYLKFAKLAFEWFFGKNRLGRSLYDPETRGIKDGLTPQGPNENQGAESILSFLLAYFTLREIL